MGTFKVVCVLAVLFGLYLLGAKALASPGPIGMYLDGYRRMNAVLTFFVFLFIAYHTFWAALAATGH